MDHWASEGSETKDCFLLWRFEEFSLTLREKKVASRIGWTSERGWKATKAVQKMREWQINDWKRRQMSPTRLSRRFQMGRWLKRNCKRDYILEGKISWGDLKKLMRCSCSKHWCVRVSNDQMMTQRRRKKIFEKKRTWNREIVEGIFRSLLKDKSRFSKSEGRQSNRVSISSMRFDERERTWNINEK